LSWNQVISATSRCLRVMPSNRLLSLMIVAPYSTGA
jgi:hypothetical protein